MSQSIWSPVLPSFSNTVSRAALPAIFGLVAALLDGCVSPPSGPPGKPPVAFEIPAPADAGRAGPELPSSSPVEPPAAPTPPVPACACPETPPAKPVEPLPEPPRGHLSVATWAELPDWRAEQLAPALGALLQSCIALHTRTAWQTVCAAATALPEKIKNRRLREFFEDHFTPYRVANGDGSVTGMITGYYEPLLYGSRTRSERYRYPLYAAPDNLLTIDLADLYPELKNKRLRGRLEGNRVIPYYTRAELETADPPIKGKELVWVDDPVEAFFLQIQGSGQVKLDTGETMRVGYADQNGHPFRSVGRYLIETRELRLEQTSMQGIKAWARRNPQKLDAFLNFNPSYVFFRELPLNLPGPIGALGVPLTAERSIAVDQRVIPLGAPVYLSTTWPNSPKPLNRLMLAQDTGGAINGGVRADFFWGFGDDAGQLAGMMKQSGRMWVLFPKDYSPPPPQ